MDIYGRTMDVLSNCVICGYSDRWGIARVWISMDSRGVFGKLVITNRINHTKEANKGGRYDPCSID